MRKDFYIVGIGASAGGHEALCQFFSHLPPTLSAAFVVVTHLMRNFRSELPHIISRYTFMNVQRIYNGQEVRPGNVYVMPENVQVTLQNRQLLLHPRQEGDRVNRSVDEFFFSLASSAKAKSVGVVLSGMGTDGAKGSAAIHEAGGLVLVQEPSSTLFNSMPMSVIREDHPQGVLSPERLGDYLVQQLDARELQEK